MALGAQVVNLIGLHLLDDADQVGAVGEIAVMEHQAGIALVGVLVEVIDAAGVEAAGPPLDAVHRIALFQQELGQVGTVLAGDAGDKGNLARQNGHGAGQNGLWHRIQRR
jgi:hypothetical protein